MRGRNRRSASRGAERLGVLHACARDWMDKRVNGQRKRGQRRLANLAGFCDPSAEFLGPLDKIMRSGHQPGLVLHQRVHGLSLRQQLHARNGRSTVASRLAQACASRLGHWASTHPCECIQFRGDRPRALGALTAPGGRSAGSARPDDAAPCALSSAPRSAGHCRGRAAG